MPRLRLRAASPGLALIIACLVLAGCGSSSSSSSPTATAASKSGKVAKSTTALKLISPGYLTVGSDTTYPPMESADPNHPGQYVGADIDLAQALAKAMGLKGAKIKNNSFDTIIPALQRKNFDVIMSSMNDTPERAKVIAFVNYMRSSQAILVRKSSGIHADSYAQVCGKTVAVQSGTTELDGLLKANTGSCKITIKQFKADTDAFQAFNAGHADAYTGDLPVVALYAKEHSSKFVEAGKPFAAGEDYGIGLLKTNPGLKQALQSALDTIKTNGQYKQILDKWGVGGAAT